MTALLTSLVVAVRVLIDSSGELLTAADDLTHLAWGWLGGAVVAEVASYVAYGQAQRHLLLSGGGVALPLSTMSALAVAAQAAANCLPGGVAVSGTVTYRRLSRRGVDGALCGWMLTLSAMLYAAALAGLALAGVGFAGDASSSVPDLRLTSSVLLASLAFVGVALYALRHRRLPSRLMLGTAGRLDEFVRERRPARDDESRTATRWVQHLVSIRPAPKDVLLAGAFLLLCWLLDVLCLALAFPALGGQPPWRGLLLSYTAAQLAALLPFIPGGLGVVEGSLTVALVAYGGSAPTALAAVLLYRLISFWGLLPVGALSYAWLRRQEHGAHPRPGGQAAHG